MDSTLHFNKNANEFSFVLMGQSLRDSFKLIMRVITGG